MRVLHIALTDSGGAGMGMMNQHRALCAMGIDSRVLVATKRSDDPMVTAMRPNLNLWGSNRYAQFAQRAACRLGICLNAFDRYHHLIYNVRRKQPADFDNPYSQYDVAHHPLVEWADVINLHYISGFVDVPSFFGCIKKPVVWTMRDESAGLGGFHYTEAKQKAHSCYAPLENIFLDIKQRAINSCEQLHIVSLSKTMQHFCESIDFLASRPNTIIPNAISPDDYQLHDRTEARRALGINTNDIIVGFVCCSLGEERKGFSIALDAVRRLNGNGRLLCVGTDNVDIDSPDIIKLGTINDKRRLSLAYSASDIFLNASSQESFGKTIVEALYCGTPVVSTSVGIAPDIITLSNGCLCAERTPQAIAQAIAQVLATNYRRDDIRRNAITCFAPERVAEQYAKLYSTIADATNFPQNSLKNSNMPPKVSVVTVCYNCCDVIEATIRNVLAQTYSNMEYIVIDGASTDGTRDIVARYADRLAYWVSEPDKGIYDAMNKGIRAASGEWIIFRNAGDYFFQPTTIADVFGWYVDRGEAVVTGGIRNFSAEGYRDRLYNDNAADVWSRAFGIAHPAAFIRMTVQKANPYSTHYRIGSDYRLFLMLMLKGATVAAYDGIVALFECERGISSTQLAQCWREILQIRKELGAPQSIIRATRHRYIRTRICSMVVSVIKLNRRLYRMYTNRHKEDGWTQQPLSVTLKDI